MPGWTQRSRCRQLGATRCPIAMTPSAGCNAHTCRWPRVRTLPSAPWGEPVFPSQRRNLQVTSIEAVLPEMHGDIGPASTVVSESTDEPHDGVTRLVVWWVRAPIMLVKFWHAVNH